MSAKERTETTGCHPSVTDADVTAMLVAAGWNADIAEQWTRENVNAAPDVRRALESFARASGDATPTPTRDARTLTGRVQRYLAHTALCGMRGGYGYCTCGLDEFIAEWNAPQKHEAPDSRDWIITQLRTALENWGRHHDWCKGPSPLQCNCGYRAALETGYEVSAGIMVAGASRETAGGTLEKDREGPRQGGTPPQFPVAELPTMDEVEGLVRLIVESFRDAPNPSVDIAVEEILMTVEPWHRATQRQAVDPRLLLEDVMARMDRIVDRVERSDTPNPLLTSPVGDQETPRIGDALAKHGIGPAPQSDAEAAREDVRMTAGHSVSAEAEERRRLVDIFNHLCPHKIDTRVHHCADCDGDPR